MKTKKTGGQKSRLRVDPFTLTYLLCDQNTTLSEVQQRTGIDPVELEPLRTAHKVHLDTIKRLAAGLNTSVYHLMITEHSPWTIHNAEHVGFENFIYLDFDEDENAEPKENPLNL